MALKLNENQRRILRCIQLDAHRPLHEVAAICGCREHVVQYNIADFIKRGLIRFSAYLNLAPLNYIRCNFFFSIERNKPGPNTNFLRALINSPFTIFVAEVGGEFEYEVSLAFPNQSELAKFFDRLSDSAEGTVSNKSFVVTTSKHLFGSKFLCPEQDAPVLSMNLESPQVQIDEVDRKLLHGLANLRYRSFSELAKKIEVPCSTLQYHRRYLEEAKVILGYYYIFESELHGMLRFKALLSARRTDLESCKRLVEFCRKHPSIDLMTSCFGTHDFEFVVQARDYAEALSLRSGLLNDLRDLIRDISIFPCFKVHKFSDYPMETLSAPAPQTQDSFRQNLRAA